MLDERSYRGPNTPNRQTAAGDETAFLGGSQTTWVKQRLLASKARWKVIASDMPIGVVVKDGPSNFEAFANGAGGVGARDRAGRAAALHQTKQDQKRRLDHDVHYCAAHYYDPARAQFTDFDPFWEFVAGPLNAGAFKPGEMDDTFGPQVKFAGTRRPEAEPLAERRLSILRRS